MPDEDRFLIGRELGVLWEPFPVNKCEFQFSVFGGLCKSGLFSQKSDFLFFFFDIVGTGWQVGAESDRFV